MFVDNLSNVNAPGRKTMQLGMVRVKLVDGLPSAASKEPMVFYRLCASAYRNLNYAFLLAIPGPRGVSHRYGTACHVSLSLFTSWTECHAPASQSRITSVNIRHFLAGCQDVHKTSRDMKTICLRLYVLPASCSPRDAVFNNNKTSR